MNFYSLSEYKDLEKELKRCIGLNINLLVVTMVGYSVPFFVKKFIEKNPKDLAYITKLGQKLSKFNILDPDFSVNENSIPMVEDYVRNATTSQKFALIVNTPHILENPEFRKTYIGTHFYSIYKFKKPNIHTVEELSDRMGVSLDKKELDNLYSLSGGIGRLVKFLLTSKGLLNENSQDIINNEQIGFLITPIVEEIAKCSPSLLGEFGVKENGKFTSGIIEAYFKKHPQDEPLLLDITPELMLKENGEENSRLNRVEASVLKLAVANKGLIEKEKIADIKWGEGSYDEYSDQAIVKTIRRLNKKLKLYKFSTISGVGYKLALK